ncbi:site-specific integrase [Psychroserpens sp.]|uniref:tyrosine-type recombinase/integrase n=1 Tax=Psychroserpens sp. TaxID=2020870 RepID=UPI002B27608A|nr:site-specific integrase [Psychroserpens sp.]
MQQHKHKISYVTKENQLENLLDIYLSECLFVRGLSPRTIKGYREVFKTFQKIVPEVSAIEHLNPNIIIQFFTKLGTRKRFEGKHLKVGVKASTVRTYYNKLMAFFNWLEVNGYLEFGYISKKIKRPPEPKYTDKRALSNSDVSKIITAIVTNTTNDEFLRVRDLTIVYSLLYLGVRRSELLGLRVQDIDFIKRNVLVNYETSKSTENRYIPLHTTLEDHLRELLRLRKERVITTSYLINSSKEDKVLSVHGLKHWVEKYKRLSGVRFHLHRFRHTFTCELAKKGADMRTIMKLLGHTSSKMTEAYLRSLSSEKAQQFIDELGF